MTIFPRCRNNSIKSRPSWVWEEASKGSNKNLNLGAQSKKFINKTEESLLRVIVKRWRTISSHWGLSTWQVPHRLTIWTWGGTTTTRTFACTRGVTDLISSSPLTKMRPYSTDYIKRKTVLAVKRNTQKTLLRSKVTIIIPMRRSTCRNPLESRIAKFTGRSLLRLWDLSWGKLQTRYNKAQ